MHFNESEATAIGIKEGDFSKLIETLEEHEIFLSVAGIQNTSCKTISTLLKETEIYYRTNDADFQGNILCVHDTERFTKICAPNSNSIHEAWLSVIKDISWDIDECIERYGCVDIGNFLRDLLVYITQFTLITKLRE